MNKHTIALLAILVVMGGALFAMADYQHGKALPPKSAAAAGGLVINGQSASGLVINGLAAGASAPAPAAPAASALPAVEPAPGASTCP
jgi:hypothetical protein